MSGIQIISSAGAGSQTLYGTQSLTNVAQGFIAGGLLALSMGFAVASADSPARNVAFEFASTSEYSGRLDFTPGVRPVALRGLDSAELSHPEVQNVSGGIMPPGWDSARIGVSVVSGDYLARSVQFNFELVDPAVLAQHFNFGGASVLSAAGGFESASFGALDVDAPITVPTESWDSLRIGFPIISGDYLARDVRFVFELVQPASLAQHFNFGGANVLAGQGLDSAEFGRADIANGSLGAMFSGLASLQTGFSIVSEDTPARDLRFDLTQVTTPNAANISFAFGGNTRSARYEGLDSFTAGDQYIWVIPLITPVGWDSFEAGEDIGTIWLLYPQALDSLEFGRSGAHFPGYILGHGWQDTVFGMPEVPPLVFSGVRSEAWGQIEVTITEAPVPQTIELEGLDATLWPPEDSWFFVSNYWRLLHNVGGVDTFLSEAEEWRVSHSPQFIYLPFDARMTEMGQPPVIGYEKVLEFKSSKLFARYGTAIVDHARILPRGLDATLFGALGTANSGRALKFVGMPLTSWGEATQFFNYISPVYFEYYCGHLGDRCGATFSQYAHVYNHNSVIRPNGLSSLSMEYFPAGVRRSGRPVYLSGFDSFATAPYWQPRTMVDFAVRPYNMGGFDSLTMTSWARVANSARVLHPSGFDAFQPGLPFSERMMERLFFWGVAGLRMGGAERLSEGLNEFALSGYGISSLGIGGASHVSYGAREVAPEGFESFRWARTTFTGRPVPTITPWWPQQVTQDALEMGRPALQNFIKQAFFAGLGSLSMAGRPAWVSHSPRYLGFESFTPTGFGRATVVDATQVLEVHGLPSTQFSPDANLWHDPPVTYFPKDIFVFVGGDEFLEFGTQWEILLTYIDFGKEEDGVDSFASGTHAVAGNSIIFSDKHHENHLGMLKWGRATLTGGVDVVEVGPYTKSPDSRFTTFGTFAISPHTIWCTEDAPPQAIKNHDNKRWCLVDKLCGLPDDQHPFFSKSIGSVREGPWFGKGTMISQAEELVIAVPGTYQFLSDKAKYTLGTNYIKPEGVQQPRFGFPKIATATPQTITFREGPDTSVIGTAGDYSPDAGNWYDPPSDSAIPGPGNPVTVTDNGPRYAQMSGDDSFVAGVLLVQNWSQPALFSGFEATLYEGMSYSPFEPAPVVHHYPRGPLPGDIEFTEFGTAWLSHSPRWASIIGLLSFTTEWTDFGDWFEVWNDTTMSLGFRHNIFTEYGDAVVSSGPLRISPYGINPLRPPGRAEVRHG